MRLSLTLILTLIAFASYGQDTLVACLDEFPPYQMLETPPRGEHVAALDQLADELEMELQFVTEPGFSHCIKRIENGTADVIAGILDRAERSHFLHHLPMREDTAYIFATRTDAPSINSYADLSNRLIAVSEGVYYFDKFDNDDSLQKIPLNDVHHAYKLLLAGRVDTVISSMENLSAIYAGDPQLKTKIKVQPYSYQLNRIVYFGLSKKSSHARNIKEFRAIAEKAFNEGKFSTAIHQFAADNPQYYQVKPRPVGAQ
ncbi:substrate-binding periplasmic protein [Lacimicrobium alkaliphilum]|uniref:Solute-binding protein family 3/N-terminal domain-containing protein n=1 Tax=Lacimicrobium alkaliphilum TaxID=1526571 RepID=A0ABQ1R5U8_9ALTE|nr:transporter substrate-binding domain-containing protein [Lacimicrobium alkaliphilum]GGD59216.1 hypothetical protein GCM10011357_13130 [Lacimicrobium alkaliphilum]